MLTKNKLTLIALVALTQTFINGNETIYNNFTIEQKAKGGTSIVDISSNYGFSQNPALLSYKKGWSLNVFKLSGSLSTDIIDKQDKINDLQNSDSETEQINILKELVPFNFGVGLNKVPVISLTRKNFGIAVYSNGRVDGNLLRKSSPTLYVKGNNDINIQAGISHSLMVFNHPITAGISPRYILRNTAYDKNSGSELVKITQTQIIQHVNDIQEIELDYYQSTGFALDLGFITPYKIKSIDGLLGLSIKNAISSLNGTKEINNVDRDVDTEDELVVTIGTNLEFELPVIKTIDVSSDIDLAAPTDSNYKRIHLGIEKKLGNVLNLKGGINEGFIVGGFDLNLYVLKLSYAYFGEELGETIGDNSLLTHNFQIGLFF